MVLFLRFNFTKLNSFHMPFVIKKKNDIHKKNLSTHLFPQGHSMPKVNSPNSGPPRMPNKT